MRCLCVVLSRGGRPVRGALRKAVRPRAANACAQRQTEVRLTARRRATSAAGTPRCSKRAPCKRRASNCERSIALRMITLRLRKPGAGWGILPRSAKINKCYFLAHQTFSDPDYPDRAIHKAIADMNAPNSAGPGLAGRRDRTA